VIAYIRGVLSEKEPMRVVLEAGGVGYEILIPLSTFERLPREGEETKLKTFHCVREDDEVLFGFATDAEREMFMKLTSVSGVGPRIALAILSGSSVGELSLAIANGNARRISSIKGVGKKTAEKICLELKDKVNALEALGTAEPSGKGRDPAVRDAVLALSALGFSDEISNKMVAKAIAEGAVADTETLVRKALASK